MYEKRIKNCIDFKKSSTVTAKLSKEVTKMNSIERKLKFLEDRIYLINNPRTAGNDRNGMARNIGPTSKIKEAKNLADKVYEIQKLIDNLDDPTARYVYQDELDNLEFERRNIISPTILICEGCDD